MSRVFDIANQTILADEVLDSHFTLISQPGGIEVVEMEGVSGWTCDDPHPVLSLMRWTTPNPLLAETALEQVVHRFRTQGRGFDWMTGPGTAHLVPLLYEQGFIDPPLEVAAMVRSIGAEVAPPVLDGMRIWKVEEPNDERISSVMAKGFDVPEEVGAIYHNAYLAESEFQRTDIYAVSEDGSDVPVAVGYLSYIGAGAAVLLRVSSTLESYRGRGIYKALVQHRLVQAFAEGRTQAFVHSYSPGSRKSLEAQGFESTGQLYLHRWRP